jgi:hypothetical protein
MVFALGKLSLKEGGWKAEDAQPPQTVPSCQAGPIVRHASVNSDHLREFSSNTLPKKRGSVPRKYQEPESCKFTTTRGSKICKAVSKLPGMSVAGKQHSYARYSSQSP